LTEHFTPTVAVHQTALMHLSTISLGLATKLRDGYRPGQPSSATTAIDGNYLPPPPKFGGDINPLDARGTPIAVKFL
jgi:hypothetical protein